MLRSIAFSISGARVVNQARVGAHAVVTGLVILTVTVLLASHWEATDVRVALESNLAGAHGSVVDDLANRVTATVARAAAHAVDASFLDWTLRIGSAAWNDLLLDQLTCAFLRHDETFGADADHGANWDGIHDLA